VVSKISQWSQQWLRSYEELENAEAILVNDLLDEVQKQTKRHSPSLTLTSASFRCLSTSSPPPPFAGHFLLSDGARGKQVSPAADCVCTWHRFPSGGSLMRQSLHTSLTSNVRNGCRRWRRPTELVSFGSLHCENSSPLEKSSDWKIEMLLQPSFVECQYTDPTVVGLFAVNGVSMQIQRRNEIALHLYRRCVGFALQKAPPVGLEAISYALARGGNC
jgi:hypothetical protein